jgi:Helicase associated domain
LNDVGFVWNAQEESWHRHFTLLCKYHGEFGHCHVSVNDPNYPKLGHWVKEQRRHYGLMLRSKPSHMNLDRCNKLSALNFCYDAHKSTWHQRLAELEEFKRVNGHCVVPSNAANAKLAIWVHHQRRQYRKLLTGKLSHLTSERLTALESIGFSWLPREQSSNACDERNGDDYNDARSISSGMKSDDSDDDSE